MSHIGVLAAAGSGLREWADHRRAAASLGGIHPAGAWAVHRDGVPAMGPLGHTAAKNAWEQPLVTQARGTPHRCQDYLFAVDAGDAIHGIVPGAPAPFPLPARHAGTPLDSPFSAAFWDAVRDVRRTAEPACVQHRDTSGVVALSFQIWLAPAQDDELIGVVCDVTAASRAPHAPNTGNQAYQRMISDLRTMANTLQAERDTLLELATCDYLTGVWTRQAILVLLEKVLASARRARHPVTIMMADIDGFKAINDRFGHPAGDGVLREAAQRFRSCVRISDEVGRYGGEEFLFLLPDCGGEAAISRAEQFRQAIGGKPIMVDGQPLPVTCSFGLYTIHGGSCAGHEAVRRADAALYSAKNAGRNRCMALRE